MVEGEYIRRTSELLNCCPPWVTDRQDLWCQADLFNNGTDFTDVQNKLYLLFDLIMDGQAELGGDRRCLQPCRYLRWV